jgi:protein tyrosine/serine phosphatase
MRIWNVIVLVSLGVAGLGGCAPASVGRSTQGVENFARVDGAPQTIYRGAQPTPEGVARLASNEYKVSTVIDLRDDAKDWEAGAVAANGMTYKRIPSNAGKVEPAKIREFLSTVTSAPGPVFVHCKEGRDRTGLEVAMYRILVQGWTREAAVEELRAHGYNRFWFPGIERYVMSFDPAEFRDVRAVKATSY